jgi:putative transcriptional regulator
VQEAAAIATGKITEGQSVTLSLREGLLHATPGQEGPATGVATTDAAAGEDVGVTGFEGIIDFDPGTVTVFQVPPVRSGGAGTTDSETLADACESADLVAATGVEAVVALRRADCEPAATFAGGEMAAEAAGRGLDVIVVATADIVGRVTDALRDGNIAYEVTELS